MAEIYTNDVIFVWAYLDILTLSEARGTLVSAFQRFRDLLPEAAFGAKGFPQVIMTDDCESLRQALEIVFPEAILLLCIFHVLQAVWRWLFLLQNMPLLLRTDRIIIS